MGRWFLTGVLFVLNLEPKNAPRKFLARNHQLSDYQKKSNANFVKLSRKLYQLRQYKALVSARNFHQRSADLLGQVQRMQPLSNKDWLEEAVRKERLMI